MKRHICRITTGMVVFVFLFTGMASAAGKPLIQLAVLLDTSNSMDGLIGQAKTQLWKIVNELAKAKRDGQSPELQVALYEYGKSEIALAQGYLRNLLPLTIDLDRVSEELFRLRTIGGDEYCGQVIQKAVRDLKWSADNNDLKIIFIAGNEPFSQGGVDYKIACKEAIGKGIVVNTIFCGSFQEGVATSWKDGADRAEGKYMNIDQDQQAESIAAPQDAELVRLSAEMNKTYLGYGGKGGAGIARQKEQDANAAASSPQVMAQRAVAKSSAQYRNSEWDLVDAQKEGKVKVGELKDEELPEAMRKMSKAEREKYVESLLKKREEIQKKIQQVNLEKEKYVREQWKKQSADTTFDAAVIQTVRDQAARKSFRFNQ